MASFWRENQVVKPKKLKLKESSWFEKPKCKPRSRDFFFIIFFYPYCLNFMRMKEMLWIENIVEST
jgi:hypothetical protein